MLPIPLVPMDPSPRTATCERSRRVARTTAPDPRLSLRRHEGNGRGACENLSSCARWSPKDVVELALDVGGRLAGVLGDTERRARLFGFVVTLRFRIVAAIVRLLCAPQRIGNAIIGFRELLGAPWTLLWHRCSLAALRDRLL